jgi:hypothetical protein
MIKFILIATLLGILGYALTQRNKIPGLSLAMSTICLVGIFFVLLPDTATEVANVLGVGRGTDLVVYFFIVLTLAIALNLHLKLRSAHEMATELARAIALLNSKAPNESRLPIGAAVDICRNDEP